MKTQIRRPSHGRSIYTTEYKQQALRMWKESGRSAAMVAAELGIQAPLLYRWAKEERRAAGGGGPGPEVTVAELQAENERLRSENAKLLEQREVLKKSLGILSELPPRGMPKSSK